MIARRRAIRRTRDGERDRDDRRQAFGHGRDREADPGHRRRRRAGSRGRAATPASATAATPIAPVIDAPEAVEVARQRRLERLDGAEQRRDPAELGRRAGSDRHAAAATRGDDRARVQHAAALGQRGVGRDRARRALSTGSDSPVSAASSARSAAASSSRRSAATRSPCADVEDVAGDDLLGGDLDPRAVAAHARRLGDELGQRRDRAAGAVLLREADQRVEHDDREHDEPVLDLAERERERARQRPARRSAASAPGRAAGARRSARLASGRRLRPVAGEPPARLLGASVLRGSLSSVASASARELACQSCMPLLIVAASGRPRVRGMPHHVVGVAGWRAAMADIA